MTVSTTPGRLRTDLGIAEHEIVALVGGVSKRAVAAILDLEVEHLDGTPAIIADRTDDAPFRAPGPLEPAIPDATALLVACVGADAIGRVIADQCAHAGRIAAIAGCSPYQRLTTERLARVLFSDRGSCKNRPDGAGFSVLVTDVGDQHLEMLDQLATGIGSHTVWALPTADPSRHPMIGVP